MATKMKGKLLRLSLLGIIAAVPALIGMVAIGAKVPSFAIEDQFEKKWTKADYSNKVTLYMVCDRDGYDYADNWTDKLVPKFKSRIHFVPVADVSPVPGLLKGYIRGKFKDNFTFPVLMDWEGTLVKAFDMKEGYPTLIITDKTGVIQYRAWGKGSESEVRRIQEKLEQLLDS